MEVSRALGGEDWLARDALWTNQAEGQAHVSRCTQGLRMVQSAWCGTRGDGDGAGGHVPGLRGPRTLP